MARYEHAMEPQDADGLPDHDYEVDQYECERCHLGAHRSYEEDVTIPVIYDAISNYPDGSPMYPETPVHMPNDPNYGPCRFLMIWHGVNGHCPLQD